jgi:hypothetical protein
MPGKIQLKTPSDVRRLVQKTIRTIEVEGNSAVIENAGKISQLLGQWLKAWELEKTAELERRIEALEAERQNRELREQYA